MVAVVDDTWFGVAPAVVAAAVADPGEWSRWWPRLELDVAQWRGAEGVRWRVISAESGAFTGAMEIWTESAPGGCVAHYLLRLDATDTAGRLTPRRLRAVEHRYRTQTKAALWALADRLDPDRVGRIRRR